MERLLDCYEAEQRPETRQLQPKELTGVFDTDQLMHSQLILHVARYLSHVEWHMDESIE